MKKKNRHHDGLTALVQAALSSLSFTTATVLFLGVAGGVNGQAIGPFPFDSGYEIDIGDDECLHYAGRWSPESSSSGSGGSGISVGFDTAAPFVVETTAPVIINRITDGSSSRLSWGVPWGVNVIVKSDCSNNNVLSEPIEPTVTTSTTELNGQQVPLVSISDLPTIPTSQSRSSVFVGTEANFLPSSTFLLNHTCYSQIEACEPIETGSPTTTPVVTTPTAICPAGIGSSTGNDNIGGSESIGPPISTNPTPTSSPPPTPDSTPIATTTTTTSNPTAAGSSSSSSFTNKPTYINLILGFVSTFALLILSTGFTNNIQGGGGAGTGGRFIMFISTICLIVVAILLPSSTFALESSSSSSSYPLMMKDQQQRNLQSSQQQCTINVEIVYWGCEHEVYIKNSNAGVILRDNTGDNYTEDWNTCQCQDNHKFEDIIDDGSNPFNMINNVTTTDDDTMYHHVPGGSELSPTCNLAIGRPYRDKYTGNIVSASSCISITDTTTTSSSTIGQQQQEEKEKRRMIWSAPTPSSTLVSDHHDHEEDNSSPLLEVAGVKDEEGGKPKRNYLTTAKDNNNKKTKKETNNSNKEYNQWIKELGEDWTNRALGEHASIASFASFTIELMSNGAPPNLIDSSLIAAQDELRHAKISFEIASELHTLLLSTTNDNEDNDDVVVFVEPTVLPPSKLQFQNNLTQLALGTAQEGCIDETFSAIEMAIHYDKYYSTKDDERDEDYDENNNMRFMMERIMDITRTIALEEGNHSALAWRTIQWVCNNNDSNNNGDDSGDNACQSTQNEILNPSKLFEVGRKRFPSSVEAQQIWNCIWMSLLPEVVGIGDHSSGDGQELLVELEQQANNVDDAATTSLCSWGDIVIDGTGGGSDSNNDNDKNKNKLSMLLSNKIISQVKAANKITTSLV